jgi:hypothetical protein
VLHLANVRLIDECKLIDVWGKEVWQETSPEETINVSDWPKGLYIVLIKTENRLVKQKVVVN